MNIYLVYDAGTENWGVVVATDPVTALALAHATTGLEAADLCNMLTGSGTQADIASRPFISPDPFYAKYGKTF